MNPSDIREVLDSKPFRPFRLHVSDGSSFEVLHPEFVWVLRTRVDIAVPTPDQPGVVERVHHCSLLHVTRIEELHANGTER
ncbi:MAG: hypothetical protein HY043_07325 [Verrucomicrobia bacterium]|nr:hypothetical protein [Verrucomicrobiota bacterium]